MYKIFIVEDDTTIAGVMRQKLTEWGYDVRCAADFRNVIQEYAQFAPHLVVLDIALPFFNGYHWCSEIRKLSQIPIIFVSSFSENMNIVMAVNMGGDDFITKPFDLDVLVAKINALLRRTYSFQAAQNNVLEAGGAVLNTSDASLSYNDRKIDLTKNEYRILQVLMENRGTVISRETLMTRLWETDSFIDDNTLTVNVNRLRHSLTEAGLTGLIKTKKGIGYIIE